MLVCGRLSRHLHTGVTGSYCHGPALELGGRGSWVLTPSVPLRRLTRSKSPAFTVCYLHCPLTVPRLNCDFPPCEFAPCNPCMAAGPVA